MNEESRRRLAAIAGRWNDVEQRMKQLEQLRKETLTSAVNELRYTGRKIAEVLEIAVTSNGDEADVARINEQLIIAESYLNNADHDLTDAAVLFVGLRVGRVIEYYGRHKVSLLINGFDDLYAELEKAHAIVAASRADRGNRQAIYKTLAIEQIPRLVELYNLIASRAELKLPDDETKKKLQILSIITAIGALFGIGTFCFHVFVWWTTDDVPSLSQIEQTMQKVIKENPR